MVQYQRLIIHHGRKEESGGGGCYSKRAKQKFLCLLFLSLLSCCFVMSPYYIFGFSTLSLLGTIYLSFTHNLISLFIDLSLISLFFNLLQIRFAEKSKVLVLTSHLLPLRAQKSLMVSLFFFVSFSKI